MSPPVRVVVADDHSSMRAGVRLALDGQGFLVVAEAADTAGAIQAALEHGPEICLFDVHMPGDGGIAACAEVTARLPGTRVVMLTVSRNDADVFDAIEAGASGYLLKAMDPLRLAAALRGVLAGEAAFPRTLMARVIDEFRGRARHGGSAIVRPSDHDLTSREWEVLDLLSEGLGTKEIAAKLFISDTTVRRHVGAVLRKLDVPDRESAVELVRRRSRNLNGE